MLLLKLFLIVTTQADTKEHEKRRLMKPHEFYNTYFLLFIVMYLIKCGITEVLEKPFSIESYHIWVVKVSGFGDLGEVAIIVTEKFDDGLDTVPAVLNVAVGTCNVARLGLSCVVRLNHTQNEACTSYK